MGFLSIFNIPFNGAVALSNTLTDTFHVFLPKLETVFEIFSIACVALSFTFKATSLFFILDICFFIFSMLFPSLSTFSLTFCTPALVWSCSLAAMSITTVCANFTTSI